MTLTTIILLIVIGLILVVAEIFVVPGTTIVGFIGGGLIITGIVCGFMMLDATQGWLIFSATLAITVILGYFGFRGNTFQRFAVKSSIDGKIVDQVHKLEAGMKGVTLTRCSPIGKAQFGEFVEEVYSVSEFIEANMNIEILHIKENKIFVEVIK